MTVHPGTPCIAQINTSINGQRLTRQMQTQIMNTQTEPDRTVNEGDTRYNENPVQAKKRGRGGGVTPSVNKSTIETHIQLSSGSLN